MPLRTKGWYSPRVVLSGRRTTVSAVAHLGLNKMRRMYITIRRGIGFTRHRLNTYGEELIRQVGLCVGDFVPSFVLQLLDQNLDCQPACGAFRGQLQFTTNDFLKVTRPPYPSTQKLKRRKRHSDASSSDMQPHLL